MIQRIQSVFLFVSLCFVIPMFFAPIAELAYKTGEIFALDLRGFYQNVAGETIRDKSEYSLMAFGILICILNLLIIFMYKNRLLQMRLCIYNILFLTGMMGVIFFIVYNVELNPSVSFRLPIVFPAIAVILHYLAFRGIRKDEMMVQALSRLR